MLGVLYVGYLNRYEPVEYSDFCRLIGVSEDASQSEVDRASEARDVRFFRSINEACAFARKDGRESVLQFLRPHKYEPAMSAESLPF
jgi:hypothetical protein